MPFYKRLETLFDQLATQKHIAKHRILLEAGIDPTQYRAYKRVGRLPSETTLEKLGACTLLPVSTNQLRAWKALAIYSPEIILEALQVLKEDTQAS